MVQVFENVDNVVCVLVLLLGCDGLDFVWCVYCVLLKFGVFLLQQVFVDLLCYCLQILLVELEVMQVVVSKGLVCVVMYLWVSFGGFILYVYNFIQNVCFNFDLSLLIGLYIDILLWDWGQCCVCFYVDEKQLDVVLLGYCKVVLEGVSEVEGVLGSLVWQDSSIQLLCVVNDVVGQQVKCQVWQLQLGLFSEFDGFDM